MATDEAGDWEELKAHRVGFLTQRLANMYLREIDGRKGLPLVTSLAAELGDGGDREVEASLRKKGYVVARLLIHLRQLLSGDQRLDVWIADGTAEKDLLMGMRTGAMAVADIEPACAALYAEVTAAVESGRLEDLPETGDAEVVTAWVLNLRRRAGFPDLGETARRFGDVVSSGSLRVESARELVDACLAAVPPACLAVIAVAHLGDAVHVIYAGSVTAHLEALSDKNRNKGKQPKGKASAVVGTDGSSLKVTYHSMHAWCALLQRGTPACLLALRPLRLVWSTPGWDALAASLFPQAATIRYQWERAVLAIRGLLIGSGKRKDDQGEPLGDQGGWTLECIVLVCICL